MSRYPIFIGAAHTATVIQITVNTMDVGIKILLPRLLTIILPSQKISFQFLSTMKWLKICPYLLPIIVGMIIAMLAIVDPTSLVNTSPQTDNIDIHQSHVSW